AAMHFDQAPHHGQPQSKTSGTGPLPSRRAAVAEAIKYQGQNFRADPFAGVADGKPQVAASAFRAHLNVAAGGRESDRVGNQVPDDLVQTIGVAGDYSGLRVNL